MAPEDRIAVLEAEGTAVRRQLPVVLGLVQMRVFLDDNTGSFDSNRAEYDVLMLTVYVEVSSGFRVSTGAEAFAPYPRSIFSALNKQDMVCSAARLNCYSTVDEAGYGTGSRDRERGNVVNGCLAAT